MKNVKAAMPLALAIHILAVISIAGCSGDSQKYNPYVGPLLDLPPKEVGQFTLVESKELNHSAPYLTGCVDAIGTLYNSNDQQRTVEFCIASYPSAAEAVAGLEAVRMHGGGDTVRIGGKIDGKEWKTEDKNSKEGLAGKRLASGNDVYWTNGNLLLAIQIFPNDADPTVFERGLAL